MSSSRSLVVSAVSATIIAIVLVSGVVAIGVLNTTRTTEAIPPNSVHTTTVQGNSLSTTMSSIQPASSTSSSSSASSPPPNGTGDLSVLITDPPTVPTGVTNVYITFENLGIHVSGAANDSGWHILDVQGQIDLMSVINSTQTVATANITSGKFNALEFNVTSATVTFQGSNYTADLVYQEHTLFVPIIGGISVTNGEPSAAVIDVSPTVLLLGNLTNPTFAFIPSATAYTIPAQSVSTLHLQVGSRDNIQNASWWVAIQKNSKFAITGVFLAPSSLSFNVSNTGDYPVMLRLVDLASTTSTSGGNIPFTNFEVLLMQTEVFVLERNSSIIPITEVGNGVVENMINSAGYILPVGHSMMFTYSGNITFGAAFTPTLKNPQTSGVVPGQRYVLSVTGNGLIAQTAVDASS
jgi:hypothetical protein